MRVRLGFVLTLVFVTACGAAPAASPPPTPSGTASPAAQVSPSMGATPSVPTANQSPPKPLAVGDVGEVVASDLRLRAAPGLDAAVVGAAIEWWYGWIYEGPVEVDGLTWYRVELHPTDAAPFGCEPELGNCVPPQTDGWLAAGPADGGSWFARVPCPSLPASLEELAGIHHFLLASCFGSAPISVSASLTNWCAEGENDAYVEPSWLSDACWRLASPSGAGVWLHFREALPAVPGEITVTGHFDDPEALSCVAAKPDGPTQEKAVRTCRSSFVVDEWAYAE